MFRSGLAVISAIVINNIAGGISDSVLAGIGVTNRIMMFPFRHHSGLRAPASSRWVGYNWGAKRYDRVMESHRFASVQPSSAPRLWL